MSYVLSASPDLLRLRAGLLARIREFFAERGVLEVETPALSTAGISDPAIESIGASMGGRQHWLHTSPEFAMKRLLAAGVGDSYQICRVFRDAELGRWHQPEFTLLEWYRTGWDETALMDEVEQLIRHAVGKSVAFGSLSSTPDPFGSTSVKPDRFESASGEPSRFGRAPGGPVRFASASRLTYARAFERCLGIDPHGDLTELPGCLENLGIDVPDGLDRDALLDLALSEAVVAGFDPDVLTFIHDYPASQAALAAIKPQTPPVAARFEAFAGGIELANGFRELTDPAEQRARFVREIETRRARGQPVAPLDEPFLAALEQGLPACAGVAVGIDRLVALAAGLDDVAAAMSFAHR